MYRLIFLLSLFLLLTFVSALHSTIIHVPGDSTTIQGGIDGAVDGDTVMVADGTYTGDGNRDIDFTGKAIVVMSENGPDVTIIDCEGREEDPHRGFSFTHGEGPYSILKGFMITGGFIAGGDGGAIICSDSSPRIDNCIITGNVAAQDLFNGGGGVFLSGSSSVFSNCLISRNKSSTDGGGVCTYLAHGQLPKFINCIIADNWASRSGGAVYDDQSIPSFSNCTIAGNTAGSTGGAIWSTEAKIMNSIIWNNSEPAIFIAAYISYSNVEGGWTGIGNIDADPLFFTLGEFEYFLDAGSPCIDAGGPIVNSPTNPKNDGISDWHPRWPDWIPNSPHPDMGAYGGPGNVGWLQ
jgi:hypothetical protein